MLWRLISECDHSFQFFGPNYSESMMDECPISWGEKETASFSSSMSFCRQFPLFATSKLWTLYGRQKIPFLQEKKELLAASSDPIQSLYSCSFFCWYLIPNATAQNYLPWHSKPNINHDTLPAKCKKLATTLFWPQKSRTEPTFVDSLSIPALDFD